MFTWMRTHQRKLMLVITILTIISFVWLYSDHDPTRMQKDEAVRMYDRNISYGDFQRAMRKLEVAIQLGLIDYASQLSGGSEEGAGEFAINSMLLEHEGRKLGILPDKEAVAQVITALPVFQAGGQFSWDKYEAFYQSNVAPRGFTKSEIDDVVRNSMIFDRLKKVLDSAPAVTDADVTFFSRAFQPVNGAAIVFELTDFTKDAAPTEQQIADFLKAHTAEFMTPEGRTVRFTRFALPADVDKLEGKAKIEAQQKVATASDDFAQQAAAVGFDQAAKNAGLKVETTPLFDRSGSIKPTPGLETTTAAFADTARAIAPSAFTLTTKDPVSRVIESGKEFFVANLGDVTPSRPMTLEEARPQIVQQLTSVAAQAALDKAVTKSLADIRESLKSGKSFAEATTAAGVKTTPFSGISLANEATPADQRKYADAVRLVGENEVGGFRPDYGGGFAVWVEKRLPVDQKKFDENRSQIVSEILSQRQLVLFRDWLSTAQKASGLSFYNNDRG
jgi:SurA N-terminal domain/PPIC-type PPIASE domain